MQVAGSCDPRFAGVKDAFADNFGAREELGAAVAINIHGRPVVDIWAGWMDDARTRPWRRDTLVAVFSVGKAMAAVSLLLLVQRGAVQLDAPVSRYWPGFAGEGKREVTVRMVLAHRAGLPGIRAPLAPGAAYDWEEMASALAAEQPWWRPGVTHGYHVNTFGFLAGELVRRVTGTTLGQFFRREVAGPLGADVHFGVGAHEDARVADYLFARDSVGADALAEGAPLDEARRQMLARVYLNPPELSGIGTVNTRAWRAAEIPSANGHATARGIAQIYAALLRGELLAAAVLEEAIAEASAGIDFVLGRPSRFGLGFQLTQPERPLGTGAHSFGHFGTGGSVGFADPDAGLAFAYAMNRSVPRWQNPRNRALIDAAYQSL